MLGLLVVSCGASPTKGIMPLPAASEKTPSAAALGTDHHDAVEARSHETLVINYVMSLKSVLPAPKPLGATHVILGFIEPRSAELPKTDSQGVHAWLRGATAEYSKLSLIERQELRQQLGTENMPAKLMASVGGPDVKHDKSHWPNFDPDAFGSALADTVVKLGLDGVDIDLEGWSRWVGADGKQPGSSTAGGATGSVNIRFQNENGTHFIETAHNGTREGNNIGRKDANWVVDTNGPHFVKRLTLAIRKRFEKEFSFLADSNKAKEEPELYRPERFFLSHAPQLPDFHKGKTYEGLLADPEFFDAVDFINVQFYNQFVFDSNEYIFTKDIYPNQIGAPTCLASLVNATVRLSKGVRTPEEVSAKLVLGFPCMGGSFQIDEYNHQECDAKKAAYVVSTGLALGYPLRGVFEWSAHPPQVYPELLSTWNAIIRAALQNKTLPQLGETSPLVWVNRERGGGASGGVVCHTLAPPSSHIDDGWCVRSCARDYCPKDICSDECRPSGGSGSGSSNNSMTGAQKQQEKQEKQQQERAERLAANSEQCHSIAAPESGIEDAWCIDTCSQGSCSAEFCSLGCRSLDPASLEATRQMDAPTKTLKKQQQQEQQQNAIAAQGDDECFTIAPPESHIDDEWCANSCVRNYCPEDMCSKGCTAMSSSDSATTQDGAAAFGVETHQASPHSPQPQSQSQPQP